MIWNQFERGPLFDIFGVGAAAGGGLQAAGQVGAAGIQAGATISAANTAADASRYAAQQQYQAAQNALAQQQGMFNVQQGNIAPWLAAGTGALGQLTGATQPGGQFGPDQTYAAFQPAGAAQAALQPGTFQAPTAEQAAATPGYQFAFDQGLQALQRSQAATGITGGAAAKAAQKYGQDLASTNYQQAYNNALSAYGTNQSAAQNALAAQQGVYGTQFNVQQQLQNQAFNRLAALAGIGQTASGQLNQAAGAYGANAANLLTSQGAALGAGTMGAGLYGAAGMAGLGNTFGNLATNLGQLYGANSPYAQQRALLQSVRAGPQLAVNPSTTGGIQLGLPSSPAYGGIYDEAGNYVGE